MSSALLSRVAVAPAVAAACRVSFRSMGTKTKSGVKKRFFLTGSGHIKRAKCGKRHRMISKSRSNLRRLNESGTVKGGQRAIVLKHMRVSRLNP